jgi:hypothetical protein
VLSAGRGPRVTLDEVADRRQARPRGRGRDHAAIALTVPAAHGATITVAPNEPDTAQCFPFGIGLDPGDPWTPHAAFFYRDVPAFELKPGDTIAFNLAGVNDADIQLEIALARTTTNGGIEEGQPFETVVTNAQTPLNPRGDTVIGNFELQFIAEAPFSFPGGGLIIRFSNPSASFLADDTCDQIVVNALSTDSSAFFVQRAFADADGVFPWDQQRDESIGGFQVTTVEPPAPELAPGPPPDPTPDTDPPETEITKDAPKRTDEAAVKFRFVSDEPGSTFDCKLDKKKFKTCDSPQKVRRLDQGRHKFKVRATDPAGNVDASPAKDRFKVVD